MTTGPATASPCRFLEWDSRFFGVRIASATSAPQNAADFERVLAWCGAERIDCLYLLSDVGDLATRRLAENRGFRLVDVRITFAMEGRIEGTTDDRARLARLEDVPDLRQLAAASHTQTRFWSDERFDRAACAELYATWVEQSVRGEADAVWVADHDGRAAAYVSCHVREAARGEIGLVAVAPAARGRGLGRALIERAKAWFAERACARVTVVTQGASLAAQRLYEASGFRTFSVQLWHHRWFP